MIDSYTVEQKYTNGYTPASVMRNDGITDKRERKQHLPEN
jgi:hypothetical protein